MGKEWRYKQSLQGRHLGAVSTWKICVFDSDLLPNKMKPFPLFLCGNGITYWFDFRNDANHRIPMTSWSTATFADNQNQFTSVKDAWFKFINIELRTIEVTLPNEYKEAVINLLNTRG